MTNFAVEIPALRQASVRSASLAAELRAELVALHRAVDAVLTDAWLGQAADTFDRGLSEWEAGARAMLEALDELAAALESSASAYLGCDRAGADDLAQAAR
ncbi:MAG TPA: WXG100 family type VII secretion target [Jatrophihabitans sp.]|jgi:WXG100 family type VII secretion target